MTTMTKDLQQHWIGLRPYLSIRNEREYAAAIQHLNTLLDEVGDHPRHPLYGLLDTLGTLIHAYEEEHYPMPDCDGPEMLKFLLEEHGLSQSDLPEVGSQGVVSEILNGKRQLNVRQIRALAKRFKVSPSVFV
jgi:HTH-type transcriptional regulator/antitoxin HigA